jgi:hypothetical protein
VVPVGVSLIRHFVCVLYVCVCVCDTECACLWGEVYLARLSVVDRGLAEARITSAAVLSSITYRKESSVDRSILSFIC